MGHAIIWIMGYPIDNFIFIVIWDKILRIRKQAKFTIKN